MRLSTPAAIVDCVVIFKVAILSQLSGHKHQIETLGSNPFRCESFVIFCFVFTQTSVWRCPIWRTFDSQVLVDTRTPGSLGFQGKPWICWLKPGLPCQGPSWIMSRDLKIRRCGTPGLCVCFADDEIWYEKLYFIYIYWQYPWYSCIFFVTYFLFDQNKYASYFIVPCGVGLGLYTPRNSSRRI